MAAIGNYIVESDIDNWPDVVSASDDFAAATDVDIDNDKITTVDIATGSRIRFSSTGVLPAPLETGVAYYAINVDGTHIKVATTPVNAAAGTAIDITDEGVGTHTVDVGEGSSEVDRQAAIDSVETLIERLTKDFFYSKVLDIYIDGNGKDKLYLGLIPNILTITEIKVYSVVLPDSWWTYDKTAIYLNPEAVSDDAGDLAELHFRIKHKQVLFPEGMGNIQVTGTYGWTVCPANVKQVAVILCRADNDETLYEVYSDFASEKLGEHAVSLGSRKFLTGIVEADRLLKSYIKKKLMMGVA